MVRRILSFALALLSCMLCGSTMAATRTWSGASSANWSDGGNWSPSGPLVAGDDLFIPVGSREAMTNDLPAGFAVGSVTFGEGFSRFTTVTLSGNPLTLNGDLRFLNFAPQFTCSTDLKIGKTLHLGVGWGGEYRGTIDVNGKTLTIDAGNSFRGPINGTGEIVANGGNITITNGAFSGSIAGPVRLIGTMPNLDKIGSGFLYGKGTIGNVTGQGSASGVMPGANSTFVSDPHDAAVIHTKSLSIEGHYSVDLYPRATSDEVYVNGTVTVGGLLHIRIQTGVPSFGQVFTIIDNDGNDPVVGAFRSTTNGPLLAEGAIVSGGLYRLRLSYRGGDGNDVVLYAINETTTTLAQSSTTTHSAEPVTLTATVASRVVPDSGEVTFFNNGVAMGNVRVHNGTAVLTTTTLTEGGHHLSANYLGDNLFGPSGTPLLLTHFVQPANAVPQLSIADAARAEGDSGSRALAVRVRLEPKADQPVTVRYQSQDRTARSGEDFLGVSGTFTFAPGETMKVIDVPIVGDTTLERDEVFQLLLADANGAALQDATATVAILNDDRSYTTRSYVYAAPGGIPLSLDVHTPLSGSGPFPVIVWVSATSLYAPGGDSPALRQTGRGYVVVVPQFRAASVAPFPAQVEDLKSAVQWLRANAEQINIDPRHIGIWGGGAGAHLATLAGMMNEMPSMHGMPGHGLSSRVQAVIDWSGPADLLRLQSDAWSSCVPDYDDAMSPPSLLIGCPLQMCMDAAGAASPITCVTPDDPPILIMHGAMDCVVSPAQSRRFYEALKAAGVDATLRILDGIGAFDSSWDAAMTYEDVDAFLDRCLKEETPRRRSAGH